ncbi:hypothetical protein FS749_001606 [Ceratobasidium sp. UAMH 11750]|nr:hypothetical protein FS749_001606 [Ceratobasidium sp. UAMH 11750]
MARPAAHINRLPLEVLSLIFSVTFKLYVDSIEGKPYGPYHYPNLLSSVCTYWRRVVIATPVLWSHVDLKNFAQAKTYFQRSKNSPLHVRLARPPNKGSISRPANEDTIPRNIKSLLATHASRFSSFALSAQPAGVTNTLSILLPQLMEDVLEDLALQIQTGEGDECSILGEKLKKLFKALRTLYLEGFFLQLCDITCRNLVELSLVDPQSGRESAAELAHLLNSNPGLRSVKLRGFTCDALNNPEDIHMPSLRTLEVEGGVGERFMFWFFLVLVPGEHELDLYLDTFVPGEFAEEAITELLAGFFRRASVKSLYLKEVTAIPLSPILRSLPELQHLSLTECCIEYMETFYGIAGVAKLLVKLHTIDLNSCEIDTDDDLDPYLRTLFALPSLQSIRYFSESPEEWDVFHDLLMNEGVTAQVIKSPESNFVTFPSPFA